jgi:hypothetical protein
MTFTVQGEPTWFPPKKTDEELRVVHSRLVETPAERKVVLDAISAELSQVNAMYRGQKPSAENGLQKAGPGECAVFRVGLAGTAHAIPVTNEARIVFLCSVTFED